MLLSLPLTLNSATELSISAIRGGADRLELCANLANGGGTTPSLGLLTAVQNTIGDALIMVRLPSPTFGLMLMLMLDFGRLWCVLGRVTLSIPRKRSVSCSGTSMSSRTVASEASSLER